MYLTWSKLGRSQGEAIILEILKGYQAFTQVMIVFTIIQTMNTTNCITKLKSTMKSKLLWI